MIAAFEQARNAALIDEVPVGCIIALNDRIISVGSNKCISKSSPIRHAEIEAIEAACTVLKNYRLPDASIYVTLEPCHMCAKAIIDARIKRLIFATEEPKHGSIVSVDNFFDKSKISK